MKQIGPWWVVAKEERNGEKIFCIYEPVYDFGPHEKKCLELQGQGREVTIETTEIAKEQLIEAYEGYGFKYTQKDILFGEASSV